MSALCASVAQSDVRVAPESGRAVLIENEQLRAVIDPDRGGAVVSFIYKPTGRDVVQRDRKNVGLFLDHFWGQTWPGELLESPYKIEILDSGPSRVRVKASRTVTGEWRGTQQGIIKGLLLEKTYEVRADIGALFCHVAVKNPQSSGRLPAYWPQHVFFIGGDYDAHTDCFYRPSTRGVRRSHRDTKREDFLRDPLAGWSAAVDTVKGDGLVFLMDYNYLDMLYNCGGNLTLEWMYDKIPVPAGRQWETDILITPTTTIKDVAHASRNFIAGLAVNRQRDEVILEHQLRATIEGVSDVSLTTEALGAIDQRRSKSETVNIGKLSTEVKSISQSVQIEAQDPLVINVRVTGQRGGQQFQESYFVFHAGGYGYADNIQQDMVTPVYRIARPEKHQALMKPAKIERVRGETPRVFVLRGLNSEVFRIDDALKKFGCSAEDEKHCRSGFYSIGQAGPRTTDFPFDYEALMSYDVIVVANANVQCLGRLGLEMLKDYATHGGGLLFLGGKAAYGAGGLRGSALEEFLPVAPPDSRFDIVRLAQGPLRFESAHAITAGISLKGKAFVCRYVHQAAIPDGAQVLLRAGEHPFLVVEQVEQGRIACVLGAPYARAEQGNIIFGAEEWAALLARTLRWLSQRGALP